MQSSPKKQKFWSLDKAGLCLFGLIIALFYILVFYQSYHQTQTIHVSNADEARSILTEGSSFTIGWKPKSFTALVLQKDDDGFLLPDGSKILYETISFARKGESTSVPSNEWSYGRDPISRLIQMIPDGQSIYLILKAPPEFNTIVKKSNNEEFIGADGKSIRYSDVGYVIKKIPFYEAFPKNLAKDIIMIPAFLLWAFVDAIAMLGYH